MGNTSQRCIQVMGAGDIDQGEATRNITLRSVQETRLGTSYPHHGPKVHPGDRVGDKLPALSP